jgi:hypothetical protein
MVKGMSVSFLSGGTWGQFPGCPGFRMRFVGRTRCRDYRYLRAAFKM